jgi:hypothetical protein
MQPAPAVNPSRDWRSEQARWKRGEPAPATTHTDQDWFFCWKIIGLAQRLGGQLPGAPHPSVYLATISPIRRLTFITLERLLSCFAPSSFA